MSRVTILLSQGGRSILAVISIMAPSIGLAATQSQYRMQKTHIGFLAAGTEIRGISGYNQDLFLANISFAKESDPHSARLIDEYSVLFPPLPVNIPTSPNGAHLRVRHNAQSRLPHGVVLLGTRRGSPIAISSERPGYVATLKNAPYPHNPNRATERCADDYEATHATQWSIHMDDDPTRVRGLSRIEEPITIFQ